MRSEKLSVEEMLKRYPMPDGRRQDEYFRRFNEDTAEPSPLANKETKPMSIVLILLLAAIVLFLLSAFGVTTRVNLTDLGLACFAGAVLAGAGLI